MRSVLVAAWSAALFLSASAPSVSATLIGTPVVLVENEARSANPFAVEVNADGPRGVRVDHARRGGEGPRFGRIYSRLFGPGLSGKKPLAQVFQHSSDTNAYPAGSLPLSSGKSLVAIAIRNEANEGGLFARTLSDNAPEGDLIRIDDASRATAEPGKLVQLFDGRGLASWQDSIADNYVARARLIATDGTMSPPFDLVPVDLRAGSAFVRPLLDGFVVNFTRPKGDRRFQTGSQVYDSSGTKAGAARLWGGDRYGVAVGLMDGDILKIGVGIRSREISGRIFDKDWNGRSPERVLLSAPAYLADVTPLAGGDFVLYWRSSDNSRLYAARFSQTLQMVGDPVHFDVAQYSQPNRSVLLQDGTVLLVYAEHGTDRVMGQLMQP